MSSVATRLFAASTPSLGAVAGHSRKWCGCRFCSQPVPRPEMGSHPADRGKVVGTSEPTWRLGPMGSNLESLFRWNRPELPKADGGCQSPGKLLPGQILPGAWYSVLSSKFVDEPCYQPGVHSPWHKTPGHMHLTMACPAGANHMTLWAWLAPVCGKQDSPGGMDQLGGFDWFVPPVQLSVPPGTSEKHG